MKNFRFALHSRSATPLVVASLVILLFALAGSGFAADEKVLSGFYPYDGTTGKAPSAGLIFDQSGNLYGTTRHSKMTACRARFFNGHASVRQLARGLHRSGRDLKDGAASVSFVAIMVCAAQRGCAVQVPASVED